jgi:UDP-N-acetylmuramate dehydrogenase
MGKTNFKSLTTLKVGGEIEYFKKVSSKEELIKVVKFAKKNNLTVFILGGGSDIAPSDKNFNGLVIKYTGDTIKISKNTITADAGVIWDDLVKITVEKNLQGIECLQEFPELLALHQSRILEHMAKNWRTHF